MSIEKIERDLYQLVAPLFSNLRFNLVLDSILDGNTPAWVFLNQDGMPRAALMWNRMDALLLGAKSASLDDMEQLRRILTKSIIPDAKSRGIPELTLVFDFVKGLQNAEAIVAGLDFRLAKRRFYQFNKPKLKPELFLPEETQVCFIDQELLFHQRYQNIEKVIGWILSFWETEEIFLDRGFGFFIRTRDVITSWCLSVYASGNHYELGLETVKAARKQGHATAAAAAAVRYCYQNGYTPHWHCWNDNQGSIAVAQKTGFHRPMGYSVFRIILSD